MKTSFQVSLSLTPSGKVEKNMELVNKFDEKELQVEDDESTLVQVPSKKTQDTSFAFSALCVCMGCPPPGGWGAYEKSRSALGFGWFLVGCLLMFLQIAVLLYSMFDSLKSIVRISSMNYTGYDLRFNVAKNGWDVAPMHRQVDRNLTHIYTPYKRACYGGFGSSANRFSDFVQEGFDPFITKNNFTCIYYTKIGWTGILLSRMCSMVKPISTFYFSFYLSRKLGQKDLGRLLWGNKQVIDALSTKSNILFSILALIYAQCVAVAVSFMFVSKNDILMTIIVHLSFSQIASQWSVTKSLSISIEKALEDHQENLIKIVSVNISKKELNNRLQRRMTIGGHVSNTISESTMRGATTGGISSDTSCTESSDTTPGSYQNKDKGSLLLKHILVENLKIQKIAESFNSEVQFFYLVSMLSDLGNGVGNTLATVESLSFGGLGDSQFGLLLAINVSYISINFALQLAVCYDATQIDTRAERLVDAIARNPELDFRDKAGVFLSLERIRPQFKLYGFAITRSRIISLGLLAASALIPAVFSAYLSYV
eukprot:g3678.t1